MTPSPRILLVDDHTLVRHGIKLMLEAQHGIDVVGEAANEKEALAKTAQLQPDLVVMDLDLDGASGLAATRHLLAAHPAAKIVILSAETSPETAQQALQVGASGYVVKGSSSDELARAIHTVADGRCYLCPEIATALIRANSLQPPLSGTTPPLLTDRDRELIRLVASGLRNKEIAEKFSLSVKAIEASRSKLMHKLGCSSAAELVRYAVREGIAEA